MSEFTFLCGHTGTLPHVSSPGLAARMASIADCNACLDQQRHTSSAAIMAAVAKQNALDQFPPLVGAADDCGAAEVVRCTLHIRFLLALDDFLVEDSKLHPDDNATKETMRHVVAARINEMLRDPTRNNAAMWVLFGYACERLEDDLIGPPTASRAEVLARIVGGAAGIWSGITTKDKPTVASILHRFKETLRWLTPEQNRRGS